MHRPLNKQRLQQLEQLLLNIIVGRGLYQSELSEEDDDIEVLLVMANLLAEELSETLRYVNFIIAPGATLEYVNMIFILDTTYQIQYTNPTVNALFGIDAPVAIGDSFSGLLTGHSLQTWKLIAQDLLYATDYHAQHQLTFKMPGKLTKTCTCAVSLVHSVGLSVSFILITTFESSLKSLFLEGRFKKVLHAQEAISEKRKGKPFIMSNENDIRIIQNIRNHILLNLEQPLPGLKALAHQFGINEYKLKYGFKQLFGTTVYRFLTQERLKRSSLLLQNTSLAVKTIARMTGFKNVSHFSKAFKIKYGVRPLALRKMRER
ncbi:MAG: AraC family transcriptional regulator [Gelidibacter sp.]